jgi:hypothetical protein
VDQLTCYPLSSFEPGDLTAVELAFANVEKCHLAQAWLEMPDPGFQSGEVRTGWTQGALWIYTVLHDTDIFNLADGPNQPLWRLGDVFEIFLQPLGGGGYYEIHVTPENQTLQLFWPEHDSNARVRRGELPRGIEHRKTEIEGFHSRTWFESGIWRVLAAVPSRLWSVKGLLEGQTCRFSFCRYDMTRDENGQFSAPPVLSSTSQHHIADFHLHSEWRELIFAVAP